MRPSNTLNRTLGLKLAIVVVVGNIVGSGIYKKVAPMAAVLDSAWLVLICWALAGVVTLFGTLSSMELAGMLADTGGEFVYFKRIYNRFFSYLYGWSNLAILKTATISSLAYVFAQSLNELITLPQLLTQLNEVSFLGVFYPFADLNVKVVAILLILLLTLFNTQGIKAGVGLSTTLLVLILIGIFVIVFFGLSSEQSNVVQMSSGSGFSEIGFSAILTAMLAAFWGYEGWNSVGFVAGEIKDPHKNIPLSLLYGLLIVVGLYLLVNFAYLTLLSTQQLTSIYESNNKIAAVEAVKVFWGEKGGMVVSFLILVTVLACTHASVLSSSRIYYAMGKKGMLFSSIGKLNKSRVPGNSLWLQGIWSSVLVMSGTFDQLTDMLVFAAFIFYAATAFGVIVMRLKEPNLERPYRTWGYPFVPILYVLFCVALIVNTISTRPREAAIGLALVAAGIPLYFYFRKGMEK
ncbi:MAG TPA: amino acid permease [Cyclobacteriaceae bacterium]|nr:amino acid permease [Cyclobacteriaceae bacterium]